jgi:isochorismate hydrolase
MAANAGDLYGSAHLKSSWDIWGARTLILTGVAANICAFFTGIDAYMRGFSLVVPPDCVASNTLEENRHAIEEMGSILKADLRPSEEIDFAKLQIAKAKTSRATTKPRTQKANFTAVKW